jgi:secretion/DNA translocation related TadE-like protein
MRNERGSATVLALGLLVVAVTLALSLVRVGVAEVVARRAQTAAEASALAAADQLALGEPPEVARVIAEEVAQANGAELLSCVCGDDEAVVGVQVRQRGGPTLRRRARAVIDACTTCGP